METLVPAFVVALFAQSIDRTPWLCAVLADRYRRPATVFAAAVAAIAAGNALAAAGGALIAPSLNPQAQSMVLALALLFAGGGALLPVGAPDRLSGWRIGAGATTLLGVFILAFGDAAQFLTLALAARPAGPMPAAIGATAGCAVALLPALLLGEAAWMKLPLRRIRLMTGGGFVVAGTIALLGAFRIL